MKLGFASAEKPQWPKVDFYVDAARNLGHDVQRATHWNQLPALLGSCDLVICGQKDLAGHWPNVLPALAERRCPVMYLWFDLIATSVDLPLVQQPLFQTYQRLLCAADITIVKERSLLGEYRAAGVNAWWCDQGCPTSMPAVEPAAELEWDMLLWGQGGGHYRDRQRAVAAAVREGFKVAWAGMAPVPRGVQHLPYTKWNELPALASRARCVLSVGRRNDIDGYRSDGWWFAVGMGACVIRHATPGLPAGPYWTYETDGELIERLRWVVDHPVEAADMGRAAREWVMQEHSIERRVVDLLRIAAVTAMEPAGSA